MEPGRSLIKRKNRRGPGTERWGAPAYNGCLNSSRKVTHDPVKDIGMQVEERKLVYKA